MEDKEINNNNQQATDSAVQQAALRNAQLEAANKSILELGVEGPAGVFPSMYRDRDRRLAESAEFASKKEFDYLDYSTYMAEHKATEEGGIASRYVLKNPSINTEFGPVSDMFEQRGYDISDAYAMMNSVNASPEDKEIFAKYIKLNGGDTSIPECKDFFDMINIAKTFTTIQQRYNRQDNKEISFIINSGTTNDGLNRYWQPQLKSMGIDYKLTPDEYGKATIPVDRLASAPYFAYAFIESYDYDYTNKVKEEDIENYEIKGNPDSQFIKEDSSNTTWITTASSPYDREQLISINNITNDRDGGTWRYYRNLREKWGDFMTGSGKIIGGWQGDNEIEKFIDNKNISYEQLEQDTGIKMSDYENQREDISLKYLDANIIHAMRPVHDIIKQAIQRMGLPQDQVVTGRMLSIGTLEEGRIDEAQNKEEQKATQLAPLRQNINQIPYLFSKATLDPKGYIGYHSFRDSPVKGVYEKLDPAKYDVMKERLENAIAHGRVEVHAEAIPNASENTDLMFITVDFDVSDYDTQNKSTILDSFVPGGFRSSSVKPGTDRVSIRFSASTLGGSETNAANSPIIKNKNQIDYLRRNGKGGQITLLDNFLPDALPLRVEFTGNKNVAVRLKCGRRYIDSDVEDTRSFDLDDNQLDRLAETMYAMKGLKSKLFQARYLKQIYGENDEYFLRAKDEFETQYGMAMATLATTLFWDDYKNGENIYNLIMDTKYTLGLCDKDGNDFDLFDLDRVLNYEVNKRNKKKNK